jgi:hypothetical protein
MVTVVYMIKADQESKLLIVHVFTLMLLHIMTAMFIHGAMGTV